MHVLIKRLAGAALLALALARPDAGLAHAALIGAEPADGAVLLAAPPSVRLRFNEPVSVLVVRLVGAAGEAGPLDVRTAGDTIMVTLPPELAVGGYALSYRVVSMDGHPIGGAVAFSVGDAAAVTPPAVERDAPVAGLLWLARLMMHVGLFAGIGGAFFLGVMARGAPLPAARAVTKTALAVGLAGTALALGLQGMDALAAPLSHLATPIVWRTGFDTAFGTTAMMALLALGLASTSLVARRVRRALAASALTGVGLALAASGHASAAEPRWLTATAVWVHAMAVAYWIGGLVPLCFLLRARKPAREIVRAWSAGAVVAVAALVVTGVALALVQVPTWSGLVDTAYGRLLLFKLALVAALLALAAYNRLRLTPALGRVAAVEALLGPTILVELALAAAILGIVGVWRFTPPPRAIPAISPPSVAVAYLHSKKAMAEVRLQPARPGPMQAKIFVMTADHKPLHPKEITLAIGNPELGVEAFERQAILARPGEWHVSNLVVPVAGQWQVRLDLLITDFEKAELEGSVIVQQP